MTALGLEVVPAGGVRAALARPSVTATAGELAQRSTGLLVPSYLADPPPAVPPRARGERAQRLWDHLAPQYDVPGLMLLEQACRTVDRLDALDALLAGDVDSWCDVMFVGGSYRLVIDAAANESRLLMNTLRQLLSTLKAMPKRSTEEQPADGEQPSADPAEDELTALRNKRTGTDGDAGRSRWNTRGAGLDGRA